MAMKSSLGRGLDSIFSENSIDTADSDKVTALRIADVEPKPDQPRKLFDNETLSQLADSISANGVLQPILVRRTDEGRYQIIAGERRWRAAKMAGLDEIPAILMEADALRAAQVALIENIQREDLNPYDEAEGYRMLSREYGLTQEEISVRIGKSRSAIANSLRLLDLPDDIVDMLRRGELTAGHGRALLGLRDKSMMNAIAQKAVGRGLSVRDVEALVRAANRDAVKNEEAEEEMLAVTVDYTAELEKKVMSHIGRPVKIVNSKKRRTVQIEFSDEKDLENILTALCGEDFFSEI